MPLVILLGHQEAKIPEVVSGVTLLVLKVVVVVGERLRFRESLLSSVLYNTDYCNCAVSMSMSVSMSMLTIGKPLSSVTPFRVLHLNPMLCQTVLLDYTKEI